MILINLLPWREQQRERHKVHFFYCLAATILATLLLVLLIFSIVSGQLHAELSAKQYLNNQISELDVKIAKIQTLKEQRLQLIERMQLIEQLQRSRASTVRLLDEMVRIMPKGVFLQEMHRTGDMVLLTGKAESNSRVSDLMRHIECSMWLNDPILTEIKADDKSQASLSHGFELKMTILNHPKSDTGI